MNWKSMMAGIAVGLAALGCTTPTAGPGGGASHPEGSCDSGDVWAVGDSFTQGVHGILGWPDQDPPIPAGSYVNKGYGGRTIRWLGEQLDLDLAECGPGEFPDEVVFFAGANDIGLFNSPQVQLREDMTYAVDVADSYGVDMAIIPILPMPSWSAWAHLNQKRIDFNAWTLANYASRYVDCATPFLGPGSDFMDPGYAFGDGTHLNETGVEALGGCIHSR